MARTCSALGLSIDCPWITLGPPTGYSWVARGVYAGRPWGVRWAHMGHPWIIRRSQSVGCSWVASGSPIGYPGALIYASPMGCPWVAHASYLIDLKYLLPGWGFYIVPGGIDPRGHRFLSPCVEIAYVWKGI